MLKLSWLRVVVAGAALLPIALTGCPKSQDQAGAIGKGGSANQVETPEVVVKATASAEDVKAARARIEALGSRSKYAPTSGDLLTEIVIQDGSSLTSDDFALFGRLTDLEKLQVFNCRVLDDEMAAKLGGLKNLTTLALTNSTVNDPAVEMIVKSFPNLIDLDLSSNTNLTSAVMKTICELTKLQRLTLVQNRFNDISTRRLEKLQDLKALDLRGNMEAGDLEVIAALPKLTAFKHRSTAVGDSSLEQLSQNQTLESLLMQDFIVSDQSGPHLAKLGKLTQLEIFRCQGFGTEGVLALKGMNLSRLTLRDLPNVDDRAMELFDELPKLRRLYLHELTSVGDSGLKHLENLKALELLDIWTVPQMSDATVDVIAGLTSLKELSIRVTGITDASLEKLMAMPNLQSLTIKENGSVTEEALKKLTSKKWSKLDIGASAESGDSAQ